MTLLRFKVKGYRANDFANEASLIRTAPESETIVRGAYFADAVEFKF